MCDQAGGGAPIGPSSAGTAGQSVADYVTAMHNNYRAQHVDTPPLYWDGGIAASAQAWADNCVFQHSVRGAEATIAPFPQQERYLAVSAAGQLCRPGASCQSDTALSPALPLTSIYTL